MTWKFKKTRNFDKQRMMEEFDMDVCGDAYNVRKRGIMVGTDEEAYWENDLYAEQSAEEAY